MAQLHAKQSDEDMLPPDATLAAPDEHAALSLNKKGEGTYRVVGPDSKEISIPYSKVKDLWIPYNAGASSQGGFKFADDGEGARFQKDLGYASPMNMAGAMKNVGTGAVKSATRTVTALDAWMEKHAPAFMTNKWFGLGESGAEDNKKLRDWAGTYKNTGENIGAGAEDLAEFLGVDWAAKGVTKGLPLISKLKNTNRLWPILRQGAVMSGLGAAKEDSTPSQVSASTDADHIDEFKTKWNAMSPEEQQKYADSMSADDFAKIAAHDTTTPAATSPDTSHHNALVAATLRALPAIGGNLGAWAGMAAGERLGPVGAKTGRLGGSSLGTAGGEAARQEIEHLLGWDTGKYEGNERFKDVSRMALTGLGAELLAMLADKAMTGSAMPGTKDKLGEPTTDPRIGQTPERIANKLSYAGMLDHGDPMEDMDAAKLLPKIIAKEKTNPVKNTEDLVNLYKKIREDNATAVEAHLRTPAVGLGTQTPVGQVMTTTAPAEIVTELNNRKARYLSYPPIQQVRFKKEIDAIDARLKTWQIGTQPQPVTYQNLWDLRIELNNNLSDYYALARSDKHAAALFLNEHPDLELDKLEVGIIRDKVYPEIDQAVGMPTGTTKTLQAQRGMAINLEEQTKANIAKASTQAEHAAGASPIKRANLSMYGTSHGRAGIGAHRLTSIAHAPSAIHDADARAASAFGRTWPTTLGKGILAHPGPIRPLSVGTAVRDVPVYGLTPSSASGDEQEDTAPQAQSLVENKTQADQQNPLKAMKWALYRQDKDGKVVVSDDPTGEQGWIYIDTGQPYKEQ